MADEGKKLWEGELYRLLVENVQDFSIFVISPDGEVLTWGHGCPRLMGWTESEIVGQNWRVVFTPEDCQKGAPEQEMRKAAEAGRAEDERWHVRKDGTRFRASGVLTPLYSDDGKLHGYAKIMRDVTARWEAGEQLRASEAALAAANAQKDRRWPPPTPRRTASSPSSATNSVTHWPRCGTWSASCPSGAGTTRCSARRRPCWSGSWG